MPVELGDAAPTTAALGGSLQLPVVIRVDAVDETAYFYCLCHIVIVFVLQRYKFSEMQQNSIDTFCRKFKKEQNNISTYHKINNNSYFCKRN